MSSGLKNVGGEHHQMIVRSLHAFCQVAEVAPARLAFGGEATVNAKSLLACAEAFGFLIGFKKAREHFLVLLVLLLRLGVFQRTQSQVLFPLLLHRVVGRHSQLLNHSRFINENNEARKR